VASDPRVRVFITNKDANTRVLIDPPSNTVESTLNLTRFEEDRHVGRARAA